MIHRHLNLSNNQNTLFLFIIKVRNTKKGDDYSFLIYTERYTFQRSLKGTFTFVLKFFCNLFLFRKQTSNTNKIKH